MKVPTFSSWVEAKAKLMQQYTGSLKMLPVFKAMSLI